MDNELTAAKLAEIASEHFKDIFDWMMFSDEPEAGRLLFSAGKGNAEFWHIFKMAEWNALFKADMAHHRLEALTGEFTLSLQTVAKNVNALNSNPLS